MMMVFVIDMLIDMNKEYLVKELSSQPDDVSIDDAHLKKRT